VYELISIYSHADVFKFDPEYAANEEAYAEMKREILGDSDEEDESGEEGDTEDGSDADSDVDDGISECRILRTRLGKLLTVYWIVARRG